jgi:hypothetical protein
MAARLTFKSPLLLWGLAGVALLGPLLPFHPFDLLFNFGFRHLVGARIAVAGLVSVTNICIPSMIYNALFAPNDVFEPL